jgi:hypothetical protein
LEDPDGITVAQGRLGALRAHIPVHPTRELIPGDVQLITAMKVISADPFLATVITSAARRSVASSEFSVDIVLSEVLPPARCLEYVEW